MRKNHILLLSVFYLYSLLAPMSVRAEGTYASLGTGDAADGSNDAINFSQGRVWTIDQYGKYIWLTQGRSSTTTHWAWSNDSGANWSQSSEGYTFLTRGSVAYDSINDVLHVLWTATDSNDGIIYRRYGITRDGSNNITAIARINTNVNLQLDTTSTRTLEQAVAIWLNDGSADGILLAFWSKRGTSLNEARGSMRRLSMTDADGTAGNWLALDGTGDTFSTDAPAVAADKIYSDTSGANALSAKIRGGSGSRKDDLYVFVAEEDDSTADEVLGYRATWSSGSSNWSGGWTALGTIGSMGTASGYSLKYQLITKPVIDTVNDRLYVGWARWKDGTNGDTVSIAYLNSTDTVSSTVDVYSALGTHSYAPTLDIAYDATLDDVYISYIQSTTNGDNGSIDYKTYDGSSLSSATRFYTTPGGSAGANGSADIPILYESRSSNDRLLFGFRINGALPPTAQNPHTIDWGYIALATPTPTPTSTPATSTPVALTVAGPPVCRDTAPAAPFLIAKTVSKYAVELNLDDKYTNFVLQFGTKSGVYAYGAPHITDDLYMVNLLAPGTTYYFRVAAISGCAVGPWSNEVKATTFAFLDFLTTPVVPSPSPFVNLPFTPSFTTELPLNSTPIISPTGSSVPSEIDQEKAEGRNDVSPLVIGGIVVTVGIAILILLLLKRRL